MRRDHAAFGREWSGAPPGAAREWSRARTPSRPFQSSQKNGTAREDTPEPERRGDRAERRCTCGAPGPEILHGCGKAYARMARSGVAEVGPWVTDWALASVCGRGARLPRDG